MFSFANWQRFLEEQGERLKAEGFEIRFDASTERQKMILEIMGRNAGGIFENWGRGDTDYTVLDLSASNTTPLAHRWGVMATDEAFEPLFREFLELFRHHAGGPKHT